MNLSTKQATPVILIAISFVFGVFAWEIYSETAITKSQIKDYEDKNAKLELTSEKVETFAAFVKERPDVIEKIDMILSDNNDNPNILAYLGSLAASNGILLKKISFSEIQPSPVPDAAAASSSQSSPSSKKSYKMQIIKLNFVGTYQSFKGFLRAIGNSLKIMDAAVIDFKHAIGGNPENKDQPANQAVNYEFSLSVKNYYLDNTEKISKIDSSNLYLLDKLSDFGFAENKQFTGLPLPQNYSVDSTDTGDMNNKNPF